MKGVINEWKREYRSIDFGISRRDGTLVAGLQMIFFFFPPLFVLQIKFYEIPCLKSEDKTYAEHTLEVVFCAELLVHNRHTMSSLHRREEETVAMRAFAGFDEIP